MSYLALKRAEGIWRVVWADGTGPGNSLADDLKRFKEEQMVARVVVEDLALRFLVAIREEDLDTLRTLCMDRFFQTVAVREDHLETLRKRSADRTGGWTDALAGYFARELREWFFQQTGDEFALYPDPRNVKVEKDLAVVSCRAVGELHKKLNGTLLVLYFCRTGGRWKIWTSRKAPESQPITEHLDQARQWAAEWKDPVENAKAERTVNAFLESCARKEIADNKQLFDELGMADFIAQYGDGERAMREHHDKLPPVMRYAIGKATGEPTPEFIDYLQSIHATSGSPHRVQAALLLNMLGSSLKGEHARSSTTDDPAAKVAENGAEDHATLATRTSFASLIDRVVNDDKTGSDWMIDLDTGKVYTPPTELDPEQNPKADTEKLKDWVCRQGIDATGIKAQGGELRFIEPVLAVLEKASWAGVTPQQVRDALASVADPSEKAVVGDTLYAFRTREGRMGVLQVVARGEDSPSVKIRYKLLRTASENAKVTPAVRLDLRVAATRGDDGETTLDDKVVEKYIDDLKTNGPETGRHQGDPFVWFLINDKPQSPLISADHEGHTFVLLANTPEHTILRGSEPTWSVTSVSVDRDPQGHPSIRVELDDAGSRRLGELTEAHLKRPLAILVDDRVISAPTIQIKITQRFMITGSFGIEDAGRLARAIRSGIAPSMSGIALSEPASDADAAVPALKAIINEADSGQGRDAIDLDRAQLFDLPDTKGWSRQQSDDWLADNNIDLVAEYENNLWTLITRGMNLNPIENESWDTIIATELDQAFSEEVPSTNVDMTIREQRGMRFHTLNFGVTTPLTFVFRTAEGSAGVLRVVQFSNESRSIAILFKLLKPLKGTAPPTKVRVPDALGTIGHEGVHPRRKLLGTWYGQFVDGSYLPADRWCAWEFREDGKNVYTRGHYGPDGNIDLAQGDSMVTDYKIDDQGRLMLFMPGENTKYCPFGIRNGTVYISVDHENDFVFTRAQRPAEYIQPRKASRIDCAATRYEHSFRILASRWLERTRGADGRQPVDLADLAGDEPERTLSPLGPTRTVPEGYADWDNTKREAWLQDHAGLVYLPVPTPADDEDEQLPNGTLPPGHVLLFERPMADRNELFVVRVDERGRITPRPEPISGGQLDELIKEQTGKELDAWSLDSNEATKADLSMERTSTRSVLSIAPRKPFSPQAEVELLAELNSQLPFEIQREDFIAKEKSGTLVGWAVVGTGWKPGCPIDSGALIRVWNRAAGIVRESCGQSLTSPPAAPADDATTGTWAVGRAGTGADVASLSCSAPKDKTALTRLKMPTTSITRRKKVPFASCCGLVATGGSSAG